MVAVALCCLAAVSPGGEVKKPQALPWDARVRRAERVYGRLWRRVSPYLGGSQFAPTYDIRANPIHPVRGPERAFVELGPGPRRVVLSKRLVQALGGRHQGARQRARLRAARGDLLHEWAHVLQDPRAFGNSWAAPTADYQRFGTEHGAEIFKRMMARRLYKNKPQVRRQTVRHTRGTFPRLRPASFYLREQFGDNWGRDPRTITTH